MRNICVALLLVLLAGSGCKKKDLMDKFVPEVLYYQNDKVENADFKETTLNNIDKWVIKARVSAPSKLKEVKLYKNSGNGEELLKTYTDFQLSPTVFMLNYPLEGIATQTVIKIVARDTEDKTTERSFTIKVIRTVGENK